MKRWIWIDMDDKLWMGVDGDFLCEVDMCYLLKVVMEGVSE